MTVAAQPRLVLNGVAFDPEFGLLRSLDGKGIPLRRQSLDVLGYLVAHPNRVVTKDELFQAIWPGIAVTENSLSQCVSEIRKVLGDEDQALLKTVARRGYRLALDVDAPALALEGPAIAEATLPRRSGRRLHPAGIGLAMAFVVMVLGAMAWLSLREPELPASLSIAVLPFADLSQAEAHAYLANGLTDDLTAELARVPGLFVVSRNAARAHADRSAPADIAARLGVRYLLEGSVRRSGDDVRISAHLVDASTAGQIWADRFDGSFAEIFRLQDRVVGDIVGALQLRLVPGKANLAVSGDTDDPQAYQAFRRGIEARRSDTMAGLLEAIGHLRHALALDPDFGAAAAEMAWLYWDADDERRRALGLTWKEIDDRLYESLAAASRNPSPAYHQLHAELLVREHRSDEALAELEEAVALDPSDAWTYEGLSQALIFAGRPAEARTYLETALRVDPGWNDWRRYQAGHAFFGQGNYDEAVAELRHVDLTAPNPWTKFYSLHVLVSALAHLDRQAEAAEALHTLETLLAERREGAPSLLIAQQFFVYKEPADAMRLLEGLRKAGVPDMPFELRPASFQPLDGAAIRDLVFGHELSGRRIRRTVAPYRAVVAEDGALTASVGDETVEGKMWIQGDNLCTAYPRRLTACGPVFRNPHDTGAAAGEYMQVLRFESFEFSVVPQLRAARQGQGSSAPHRP